jgi:fructose-1,6-bisphosphatase/inositol monophosphatase family enzyme
MVGDEVLQLLERCAAAVSDVLGELGDWGLAGTRDGQYRSDIAADEVALEVLLAGGVGVLSEETGLHASDRSVIVVVDPVDGSTNASRGLPWFATALCAVDDDGPLAAIVVNQSSGRRWWATRGGRAHSDRGTVAPSAATTLHTSLVGVAGLPPRHLGWGQFRALGAAALDLCCVADGTLDAYVDCVHDAHGPWDYLGAMLVCQEAGAVVADAQGRDLVVLEHAARRTPVCAATPRLLDELLAARAGAFSG